MRLAWDNKADVAVVTAGSEKASLPGSNVQHPFLSRKWHTAAGIKSSYIVFDMGQSFDCNTLAVLGTNLTSAATARLRASTSVGFDSDVKLDTRKMSGLVKDGYAAIYKAFKRPYLSLPGIAGNYASTPDSVAVDQVRDIRMKVKLDDWTAAAVQTLAAKRVATGDQRSWQFSVDVDATLRFTFSQDGIATSTRSSTAALPAADGAWIWTRVTLDPNDGAGNHVVKFYYSHDYDPTDDSGTWTQLGATVTTAGVIAVFNSNAPLEIGSINLGTTNLATGDLQYAQFRSGINGPVVAVFDPASLSGGETQVASVTGETWSINQVGNPKARIGVEDPVSARFWRLDLEDATLADNLRIGRVFIGPSWDSDDTLTYGSQVATVDPSEITKSRGGQNFADVQPQYRVLEFALDWMTEAQAFGSAFAMARANGRVKDLLAIPFKNGAYVSEQSVWGLAKVSEPVKRRRLGIFQQKFRIEESL